MVQIITAVIALIEQFLPMLGTSAATAGTIGTIINALEQIIPMVVEFAPTAYQAVKNIIAALKNDPATTTAQWEAIDTLETKLDADNDAAIAAVDPDAPDTA